MGGGVKCSKHFDAGCHRAERDDVCPPSLDVLVSSKEAVGQRPELLLRHAVAAGPVGGREDLALDARQSCLPEDSRAEAGEQRPLVNVETSQERCDGQKVRQGGGSVLPVEDIAQAIHKGCQHLRGVREDVVAACRRLQKAIGSQKELLRHPSRRTALKRSGMLADHG